MYFKKSLIIGTSPRHDFTINLYNPFIYCGELYCANLGEVKRVAHAYFGKNSSTVRNILFSSIKNREKKIIKEV